MNSKMLIHSAVYTLSHYAEGHVGMDIEESETAKKGLNKAMSNEDLKRVAEYLRAKGATATMVNLKKSRLMNRMPVCCLLRTESIGSEPTAKRYLMR